MSLNLSNVRSTTPHTALRRTLEALVPAVVEERLTLAELNDPKRTYFVRSTDAGMIAGRLQLADNTCVLVDEVCMGEGQLLDAGVRNIRALAGVMQSHTLSYQFPFSEIDLDTDLNVVVLSTGKSLLPADVHVPLRPAAGGAVDLGEAPFSASPAALQAWRAYLLTTRQSDARVPESMSAPVQNYFVERRQHGPRYAYTEVDLQRCLGIARLVAVSFGLEEQTEEAWQHATRLDEARAARLAP